MEVTLDFRHSTDKENTLKKFYICKLCLLPIFGFSVGAYTEETDTDINIFTRLDKLVLE